MKDIATLPNKKVYVKIVDESECNPLFVDMDKFTIMDIFDIDHHHEDKWIISFESMTEEEYKKLPEWQGF